MTDDKTETSHNGTPPLKALQEETDRKKEELSNRRPLTRGELERLAEDFAVEYTYNSNAIEGNTLTLRETDLVLRGLTVDKKPLRGQKAFKGSFGVSGPQGCVRLCSGTGRRKGTSD